MTAERLREIINGRKTYIVSISGLLAVVLSWSQGTITNQSAIEQAIALILAMTIRAGVTHSVESAVSKAIEPLEGLKTVADKGKFPKSVTITKSVKGSITGSDGITINFKG